MRVGEASRLWLTREAVMQVAARGEFTGVTYVLWFGFYVGFCKQRMCGGAGGGDRCSPFLPLLLRLSAALF